MVMYWIIQSILLLCMAICCFGFFGEQNLTYKKVLLVAVVVFFALIVMLHRFW